MNKLFLSLLAMCCSLASLAGVRSDFAVDTISTQVGKFTSKFNFYANTTDEVADSYMRSYIANWPTVIYRIPE